MEIRHNPLDESISLVLIDGKHLHPILSHFLKVQCARKVHKRKDIFLEARTTKSYTSFQKFRSETRIESDSSGDLVDVGTGLLADGADGVDAADSLSKHGVCDEL